MTDTHDRLLAAVTARRDLARAAHIIDVGSSVSVAWPPSPARRALLQFLQANDPAQILRDTQAHLELLDQHRPIATKVWEYLPALDGLLVDYLCQHGRRDQSIDAFPVPWPCETITALASIYPEENPA